MHWGNRGLNLDQFLAYLHSFQRVGLELDESSDRVASSFSLVCHGGHSRGCGSSVGNICVTLLTDQ